MPRTDAADLGRADTAHPYTAACAALQEPARHRAVKKPGARRRRLWGPPARRCAPSGMTSEEGAPPFLLSSPRKRGSSGSCEAPVWIPARPCGPFGMTSKLGAVREGRPARRRAPTTMTLQGAKERHILFAVIPAKAGIQRHLRGACLDPGSALRAVRDDVKRRGAVREDVPARPCGPSGMTSAEGCAIRADIKCCVAVRYRIERERDGREDGRERRDRMRPCRMSHLPGSGDFLTNPIDRLVPARRARPHQRVIPRLVHRRCG